jgi:hypothetical protein
LGLPGEIIEELPSTRAVDESMSGPLANTFDYTFDMKVFRGVTDVDRI